MLIKKDKFLTRNDLKILATGTFLTLIPITIIDKEIPKVTCFIGGLIVVGIFKKVKYDLFHQRNRNNLFSFFYWLKTFKTKYIQYIGYNMGYTALFEAITYGIDKYLENIPNWIYPLIVPSTILFTIANRFDSYGRNIKYYQSKLDEVYKESIKLLEKTNDSITIYSSKPLKDEDKKQLDISLNTNVITLTQDNYRKGVYHLKTVYGKENKYRNLEPLSIKRLEQILYDLGLKPKYINTIETDVDTIHSFYTDLNPKKVKTLSDNISKKLGTKELSDLVIKQESGIDYFYLRKEKTKTYLLDDVIKKVKLDLGYELPFIAGMDIESGKPIILDLVKTNHLLFIGATGSGKSSTFKGLIESMIYLSGGNVVFYMFDLVESALPRYRKLRNCKYYDPELSNIENVVSELKSEMNRRKQLFKELEIEKLKDYNELNQGNELPYLIFCLDEANLLKSVFDLDDDSQAIKDMYILATQARKFGIYLLMSCQQSNDKLFFKKLKTQFARLIHKVNDIADISNAGMTDKTLNPIIPRLKAGEYILDVDGQYRRIKGCLTDRHNDKLFNKLMEVYRNVDIKAIKKKQKENSQESEIRQESDKIRRNKKACN